MLNVKTSRLAVWEDSEPFLCGRIKVLLARANTSAILPNVDTPMRDDALNLQVACRQRRSIGRIERECLHQTLTEGLGDRGLTS